MAALHALAPVNPPVAQGGLAPVAPAIHAGGVAPVAPPIGHGGVAAVAPPVHASGIAPVALPVHAGGIAPVAPPVELQGRARVEVPERKLDWVLALLVWIGTKGWKYYQNETPAKTGETKTEWQTRVHQAQAVAKRELKLAWLGSVRQINPEEVAHATAFVEILRTMCNLDRMKGIHPLNKRRKDVNAPLWDVMVKQYVTWRYGAQALTDPIPPFRAPPLIV